MINLIAHVSFATMFRLTLTCGLVYQIFKDTGSYALAIVLILLFLSTELSAILHRIHKIKLDMMLRFADEVGKLATKINNLRKEADNDKA